MSRGVNKVILIGNLGADPEVRYTAGGEAVATLSLATSESWTDKQTGQAVEKTEWHRVVAFRRLGEICGEYLRKGSKVFIEGQLTTRKWQDQTGADRYTTEIVARDMQMLGAPGQGAGQQGGHPPPQRQDPPQQRQVHRPPAYGPPPGEQARRGAAAPRGAACDGPYDESIPF